MSVAATTRRREAISAARPFLDLNDDPSNWKLPDAAVCVLAAARARLADCEGDPDGSKRINATPPAALARRMADRGSLVVLLSTNQVFDGRSALRQPDDVASPITAYGHQKAAAEAAVLSLGPFGAVLRLTKVLTANLPLVEGWLKNIATASPIRAFDDMRLAPVRVEKVAEALEAICRRRAAGVFQASGDRDIAYSDFARRIAAAAGVDPGLVRGENGESAGIVAAMRPQNTTLDSTTLRSIGWVSETSDQAIRRYCTETLGLRDMP